MTRVQMKLNTEATTLRMPLKMLLNRLPSQLRTGPRKERMPPKMVVTNPPSQPSTDPATLRMPPKTRPNRLPNQEKMPPAPPPGANHENTAFAVLTIQLTAAPITVLIAFHTVVTALRNQEKLFQA